MLEITHSVSRFFAAVDRCDWPAVLALLVDQFQVDHASYGMGSATEVTPEDQFGAWTGFSPFFDSLHHPIGNFIAEGDGDPAHVQGHGLTSHLIADHLTSPT